MSGGTGRSWWRRNWWGIAAVGPLLAAALVLSPDNSFQILRDEYTEEIVRPGPDGWVSYGGARLRLTSFGAAELFDDEQQPFEVPGLTAWQVTLTVETPGDPEALFACGLELEDPAGRLYPDSPPALGSANDADGSSFYGADCARAFDEEDGTAPFETVGYFLLPESTEPVALRVSHHSEDPAYVRVEVG